MITQVRPICSRSGGRLAHLDAKVSVKIRRAKSDVTNVPDLMCVCSRWSKRLFPNGGAHPLGGGGVGLGWVLGANNRHL